MDVTFFFLSLPYFPHNSPRGKENRIDDGNFWETTQLLLSLTEPTEEFLVSISTPSPPILEQPSSINFPLLPNPQHVDPLVQPNLMTGREKQLAMTPDRRVYSRRKNPENCGTSQSSTAES